MLVNARESTFSSKLFLFGMNLLFCFQVYISFLIHSSGRQVFNTIIQHLGYYCMFASLLICIVEGSLNYINPKYKKWLLILFFQIGLLFLIGLINNNYFSKALYHTATDCFIFVFFAGIFVASKKRNLKILDKMLVFHFFLGTLLCVYGLLSTKSFIAEDIRYSLVYELWSNLLYPWPYFLLTLNKGSFKRRSIAICGLVIYVLIAILVLKRTPFIMLFLYLFFMRFNLKKFNIQNNLNGIFKKKSFSKFKLIIVFSISLLIFDQFGIFNFSKNSSENFGLSGLYNRLYHVDQAEKTTNIFDTLKNNYRWAYEPLMVLSGASNFDLIFGRGIGATIPVPLSVSIDGSSGLLHNALMVFILKGGFVFFIIWYSGMFIVFRGYFKNKIYSLNPYFVIIIVTTIMSPIGGGFLAPSNSFGLIMISLGRISSKY